MASMIDSEDPIPYANQAFCLYQMKYHDEAIIVAEEAFDHCVSDAHEYLKEQIREFLVKIRGLR